MIAILRGQLLPGVYKLSEVYIREQLIVAVSVVVLIPAVLLPERGSGIRSNKYEGLPSPDDLMYLWDAQPRGTFDVVPFKERKGIRAMCHPATSLEIWNYR
jgi:hypothetical protein